jgi:hypothetical protein
MTREFPHGTDGGFILDVNAFERAIRGGRFKLLSLTDRWARFRVEPETDHSKRD